MVVATGIDLRSMFHDLSPGVNTAVSNTLALIMATYLIGSSINYKKLDALQGQIIFAFLQGERRMATLVRVDS